MIPLRTEFFCRTTKSLSGKTKYLTRLYSEFVDYGRGYFENNVRQHVILCLSNSMYLEQEQPDESQVVFALKISDRLL